MRGRMDGGGAPARATPGDGGPAPTLSVRRGRRLGARRRGDGPDAGLTPARLPDDAPGRVRVHTVGAGQPAAPRGIPPAGAAGEPLLGPVTPEADMDPEPGSRPPAWAPSAAGMSGWVPVLALALILTVVFIVGMHLAR